jgi:hypothetical protein
MPSSSSRFTPRRTKNHGISSMNTISDICPNVCFDAGLAMPISFRKRFVNV